MARVCLGLLIGLAALSTGAVSARDKPGPSAKPPATIQRVPAEPLRDLAGRPRDRSKGLTPGALEPERPRELRRAKDRTPKDDS